VSIEVNTNDQLNGDSSFPEAIGFIAIDDRGVGMTIDAIRQGWLTISNSPKREMKKKNKTTVLGRTPLGDKGLGRLGTQRLGQNLEIYTRPEGTDVEHYVAFSWKDFRQAASLDQVPITIRSYPAKRKKGTRLVISELTDRQYWIDNGPEELQKELSRMISPYRDVGNFNLTAKFNGTSLDLMQLTENLRQTAQIHYDISFDGDELSVTGKAKIEFFRPQNATDQEDFRLLVEQDSGERFYSFLAEQPKAEGYFIKKPTDESWFVEYSGHWKLADIDNPQLVPNDNIPDINQQGSADNTAAAQEVTEPIIANPGPFSGEVDAFDLGRDVTERQVVFNDASDYKEFVKDISGVRVYRDGFGIRVEADFLRLGEAWTSARSYYGLKPSNTIGYIALTSRDNAQLEEKTDREGFKRTPYYDNFINLILQFRDFTAESQNFLRRTYVKFRSEHQKSLAGVGKKSTPEDIAKTVTNNLAKAANFKESLTGVREKLSATSHDVEDKGEEIGTRVDASGKEGKNQGDSSQTLKGRLLGAQKAVEEVEKYLDEVVNSTQAVKFLDSHIKGLQDQSREFYDTMSLGLTAEALSHEIHNIADQLAHRTQQISKYINNSRDPKLLSYTEYVNTSVNGLRKQLRHLAPALRYVREKREPIEVVQLIGETIEFYQQRFDKLGIDAQLKITKSKAFVIEMNKGKFVQILDNLLLNSEYWLREDLRMRRIKRGNILIEVAKPFVRVSDNGQGINRRVESSLFEPFVTTKSRNKGRGLGLFIVQQLLSSEGCTISLSPKRNQNNRLYIFEINFTGALNGINSVSQEGNQ
jgi:signal transduction histidine kinase